jgi:hypothetical protein
VRYGIPPAGGGSWKELLLKELDGRLDLGRIHLVGRVPHPVLHELFWVAACHVDLTYPSCSAGACWWASTRLTALWSGSLPCWPTGWRDWLEQVPLRCFRRKPLLVVEGELLARQLGVELDHIRLLERRQGDTSRQR